MLVKLRFNCSIMKEIVHDIVHGPVGLMPEGPEGPDY